MKVLECWPENLVNKIFNPSGKLVIIPPPGELTKDQLKGLAISMINLTDLARQILLYHFKYGMTYKDIANEMNITEERTYRLAKNGLKKLCQPENLKLISEGVYNVIEDYIEYRVKARIKHENFLKDNQKILFTHIQDLGLSTRSRNGLYTCGRRLYTVYDIAILNKEEIKKLRDIGSVSAREIALKMDELGLKDTDWKYFLKSKGEN